MAGQAGGPVRAEPRDVGAALSSTAPHPAAPSGRAVSPILFRLLWEGGGCRRARDSDTHLGTTPRACAHTPHLTHITHTITHTINSNSPQTKVYWWKLPLSKEMKNSKNNLHRRKTQQRQQNILRKPPKGKTHFGAVVGNLRGGPNASCFLGPPLTKSSHTQLSLACLTNRSACR